MAMCNTCQQEKGSRGRYYPDPGQIKTQLFMCADCDKAVQHKKYCLETGHLTAEEIDRTKKRIKTEFALL